MSHVGAAAPGLVPQTESGGRDGLFTGVERRIDPNIAMIVTW